ncbi:MAG: M48 family metalloprotease [Cellvibrionales bacterium]|nr:M48 family metalloprotease [Cellvibrionales bacterium]
MHPPPHPTSTPLPRRPPFRPAHLALLGLLLTSCATNPVTGKRELSFYSTEAQIALGEQHYAAGQQSQGGVYYLDPQLNAYVSKVTQKLVAASRRVFPAAPALPYEIVVLNNPVPNAWAMPGGKMAINHGLLSKMNDEAELAAVLGHEIIHAAAAHSATALSRNALFSAGGMAVNALAQGSRHSDQIGRITQLGSTAWMARYGRDDELEADHHGMRLMAEAGYDPYGAVRLQETFVALNEGGRKDFIAGLFASHPPSPQRVEANRAFATELPRGGRIGRETYQRAIAQLTRDQAAYEAQQQAIQALNAEQPQTALKTLDRAIAIQPNEGQFWELRGHAWQMTGDPANADRAYSTALQKNPNYYQHWLARGILRKQQKQPTAAQADLQRSQELLPTALAAYHLGELAEQRGDQNQALDYFQQAAQDRNQIGQAAQRKLTRHQMPATPNRYFTTAVLPNKRGDLFAAVRNDSGLTATAIQLRLTHIESQRTHTYRLPAPLQNGQRINLRTGLPGTAADYRIEVIAARPQ